VRVGRRWQALAGEGGHVTLAPEDEEEAEVLRILRRRFGHVSAERVLSGPGLSNLFMALAEIGGAPLAESSPEAITEAALTGGSALARATLSMFCSFLGSAAGNLALTLGARGGVYIGGGICPRIAHFLLASPCRDRFEAKGRMKAYLEPIPLWLINAPHTALYGAAAALLAEADRIG
jgi:glucokinase